MNQQSTFEERHRFKGNAPATASTLAYRLSDLLRVCVLAEDYDGSDLYATSGKGLGNTLQLAEKWASELIEEIELLEQKAKGGGAPDPSTPPDA